MPPISGSTASPISAGTQAGGARAFREGQGGVLSLGCLHDIVGLRAEFFIVCLAERRAREVEVKDDRVAAAARSSQLADCVNSSATAVARRAILEFDSLSRIIASKPSTNDWRCVSARSAGLSPAARNRPLESS